MAFGELATRVVLTEIESGKYEIGGELDIQTVQGWATFPCLFRKLDGTELDTVVFCQQNTNRTRETDDALYDIHATTVWCQVIVPPNEVPYVAMRDWSDKAIVWMTRSYYTYYYDRKGNSFGVDAFDNDGEDLPDSIATCKTCGHTFRVSNHFVDENCGACDKYVREEGASTLLQRTSGKG